MGKKKYFYLKVQEIIPKCNKIFVLHNFKKVELSNEYLRLLYNFSNYSNAIRVMEKSEFNTLDIIHHFIQGNPVVLHQHWFEITNFRSLVYNIFLIFCLGIAKLFLHAKIIWTIHNKNPHHHSFSKLNYIIRKNFAKFIADYLHVHCYEAKNIMKTYFKIKEKKFFIFPHPKYNVTIFSKIDSINELKGKYLFCKDLDVNNEIFLIFGLIDEYKGILEIIEIFPDEQGKVLLIIGGNRKNNKNYISKINEKLRLKKNILFYNNFIPTSDLMMFLNLSDKVVFNFKEILTSGSVELALSFEKKIIIPNKGCLKDITGPNIKKFDKLTTDLFITW